MIALLLVSTGILGWYATHSGWKAVAAAPLERIAVSWILGSIALGWLALVWVALFGYSTLNILLSCICAIGITPFVLQARISYDRRKLRTRLEELGAWLQSHIALSDVLLLAALLLFFFPLFHTHYFEIKQGAYFSAGTAWADMALHATLTNWFAFQSHFDLTNPIYSLQETTYPFLINFISGLYRRFGASLQFSLWITAVPLVLSSFYLLGKITTRYFGSSAVGLLSIFLVFTTGSAAGFLSAVRDWSTFPGTTLQFLQQMPDYGHLSVENMHWSNTITDMVLTQRGFVIGFAVWIACTWLFMHQFSQRQLPTLLKLAVIIGLLPVVHVHSFAILFGVLLWVGAWLVWKKQLSLQLYFLSISIIIVLASGQLWWQFSRTESESFTQFNWGWYTEPPESIGMFWIRHWGMYLLLLIGYPFLAHASKKLRTLLPLWSALAMLFVLNNLIQFQPNLYDNSKFLEAVQIFLCVSMAAVLVQFWKRGASILVVVTVITLSSSGLLGLIREYQISYEIATVDEVQVAEQLITTTTSDDLFITGLIHNHPAMMLAGRKTLVGYPGWLWTHGINASVEEAAVKTIYAGGEPAREMIQQYEVAYVYISHHERGTLAVNEAFFAENYRTVAQSSGISGIRVYAVGENNR